MITKKKFGMMPSGEEVFAYTMTNRAGCSATVLNMGGILASLILPDRNGVREDVVQGFDSVEGYLTGGGYLGALIGRYANRIRDGRFTLGGKEYVLAKNEGGVCHLHGGNVGFNAKIWSVEPVTAPSGDSLILRLVSPDGEEGYPGRLDVQVTYTLTDDGALRLHYEAQSDADTVCNLTNHSYFNLGGIRSGDVSSHTVQLDSDEYTEVDDLLLPIRNVPVEGTDFDLRKPRALTGAYDHNFMLHTEGKLTRVGSFSHPSGRKMVIFTDMPAIQIYTANMLCGDVPLKGGMPQTKHIAFCAETQFPPDSPNRPDFPCCTLRAGERYDSTTVFAFSWDGE